LAYRFYIKTMGCQMNEYDSDFLAQTLKDEGYRAVNSPEEADTVLINTCTVRAKPEQKALSLAGRMCELKRQSPRMILGVLGCVAQQHGAELMARFPLLDLVVGPREIHRVPELLRQSRLGREKSVATRLRVPLTRPVPGCINGRGQVKAYLSVMEGCDNFCTYCIVPYVRGREVSRSPEEILMEAERLVGTGVKEITLLGQNVNSYAWEGKRRWSFPSLLRELNRVKGLRRLRFTTSHPKDLSDDLIACFGNLDKLCPHIHLPFQAGSNSVLKRMGRGYTRDHYLELIAKLRAARPDIALTSDVMVGFPGESFNDFESTLDLIRSVRFDGLFSFKYSDRGGTKAEKMDQKVEEAEKTKRLQALQAVQREITYERNRQFEGREIEVLVESESKRGGQMSGRAPSNTIVNFNCKNSNIGKLVNVKVQHGFFNSLQGVAVS